MVDNLFFVTQVIELSRDNYVEEIENEKTVVTIIIHIYDDNVSACEAMTGCLQVSGLIFYEFNTVFLISAGKRTSGI